MRLMGRLCCSAQGTIPLSWGANGSMPAMQNLTLGNNGLINGTLPQARSMTFVVVTHVQGRGHMASPCCLSPRLNRRPSSRVLTGVGSARRTGAVTAPA